MVPGYLTTFSFLTLSSEMCTKQSWPIPQVTSNMLSNEGPVLIQIFQN
jgi:hypothetical protein